MGAYGQGDEEESNGSYNHGPIWFRQVNRLKKINQIATVQTYRVRGDNLYTQ